MVFSLYKYFNITKVHIFYITIIILLTKFHFCSPTKPDYLLKNNFPVYEDDDFEIEFSASYKKIPTYSFIMLRCKKVGITVEEHVLNPGYIKGLPRRIYGDYFVILKYKVLPYKVIVTVQFKRLAADAIFEVVFLETYSKELRSAVMHEPEKYSVHGLGHFNISLLLHWKLKLIQRTLDHREGGFIVNTSSHLICKAVGGFPFSPVKFIAIEELSRKSLEVSKTDNEIQLTFNSKIDDHLKKVGCQAGNDVIYDNIKIFHHSTKLEFVPPIKGYVRNGTSILCKAADGYPTPQASWVWVSGPDYSEYYFTINNDGNVLRIGKDAPLGSKWMFECISKNNIPNSLNRGKAETVSFIIGDRPIPYILIISILLGAVFLIILLVITIHCCRSHSSGQKKTPIFKYTNNQNTDDQDSMNKTLIFPKSDYRVDEV